MSAENIRHLQTLGEEHLYALTLSRDEMHEDEMAYALGVMTEGEPKEGKINLVSDRDGLLKVNREALFRLNMLGDVMSASLHSNSVVKKGQVVAGTRAIPLVVNREVIREALGIARVDSRVVSVMEVRKPMTGIVITGNGGGPLL